MTKELFQRALDGESPRKIIKDYLFPRKLTTAEKLEKTFDFIKNIGWIIIKFYVSYMIVMKGLYPSLGYEKTIIFLSLIIILILRKISKDLGG